jgi:outer membrane protein assembly factor BamB
MRILRLGTFHFILSTFYFFFYFLWWAAFTLWVTAVVLPAQDHWPQFRGPGSRGISENKKLPLAWSATQNVEWKTPIPGSGWSSPVVWGDRIFLTSVISSGEEEKVKGGLYFGGERPIPKEPHTWMVFCLDAKTGKILWQKELAREVPQSSRHLKNTYASETPAVDAERVYFYFGQNGVFVFDHKGNEVWRREQGPFNTLYGWGTAASPVVQGDLLILVNDNSDASCITALDKKSGKEVWRVPRDEKSTWATPFVWTNKLRTEIVTNGDKRIRSYDMNGKLLWEMQGPFGQLIIPTPFTAHDLLYVTSGYVGAKHRPVYAIRPGASGDISLPAGATKSDFVAWYDPAGGPYNPSALVYGDYYYTLFDRGFFTCNDAKTGQEVYSKQRIDPATTAFTASPWAYRDRIFVLSEDGDTFVIQPGREFKVVGKNSLNEFCMATPALVGERLIIRTQNNLYCFREP